MCRSGVPAPVIDTIIGGNSNSIQTLVVSNAGRNGDDGRQSVGVIESVVHFSVDSDTLIHVSGGGAFLQPFIELVGQVVELAGRAIVDAVFDADRGLDLMPAASS